MILITHIIASFIGIIGAYLEGYAFFKKLPGVQAIATKIAWIGLIILFITGIFLFLGDIPKYTQSVKFISNMSVLAILIVNALQRKSTRTVCISLICWTWILFIAVFV
ncbi:MAG: hypothetical protein V4519_03585 [Patescibacteria group bacterium]